MNRMKKYRRATQFIIASKKKKKHLGINLANEVKDPYNENYKPLKKEIKEDHKRLENISCS
jgi:hypothetical protein